MVIVTCRPCSKSNPIAYPNVHTGIKMGKALKNYNKYTNWQHDALNTNHMVQHLKSVQLQLECI